MVPVEAKTRQRRKDHTREGNNRRGEKLETRDAIQRDKMASSNLGAIRFNLDDSEEEEREASVERSCRKHKGELTQFLG